MKTKRFSYLCSTIGRKQLIGASGLGLSVFVLTHMLGNMLIFKSAEAYNMYGHNLTSNPLIYVAEAGLLGLFLLHLVLAIGITFRNRASREVSYAVNASGAKATSLVQKTMIHQGIIILVFVVLHLITFKFGTYYEVEYDGLVIRDLHRLMVEVFQSPIYVAWYFFALIILGFHLSHGLRSSIETLGFHHPKYQPKIKCISVLYAVLVSLGFISQPIYVFLFT